MAIYKNANLDISVSAEQNPSYNAKPSVQFSTQDKNTAKYTFTVKQNNKPVDLTGVTASVTLYSEDKSVFQSDATIISATEGKIEYVIPSEAIRHHGKTRGDLRLTYPNGDVLGGLRFSFNIEQALIDRAAGVVGGVYIRDFEQLKAEIEATAESIKDIDVVRIDTKLNELEEQIGEGVGVDEQARQEIQEVTAQLADTTNKIPNIANAANVLKLKNFYGDYQNIHPKVLYFPDGWNGYKYWMGYTPYPLGKPQYENPAISVSNNGTDWGIPTGATNDLIEPWPGTYDKYNNDTHLVFRPDLNRLELWFRTADTANKKGYLKRKITTDGKTWSTTEVLYEGAIETSEHISPAVIWEDNKYKMLSVYRNNTNRWAIGYVESADGLAWSTRRNINIDLTDGLLLWHLDFIKSDSGYEMVATGYYGSKGETSNTASLYYSKSNDLLNWSKPEIIIKPNEVSGAFDNLGIYRSSILKIDGVYYVYYSAVRDNQERGLSLAYGRNIKALKGYSVVPDSYNRLTLKDGETEAFLEPDTTKSNKLDLKQGSNPTRYGHLKVGNMFFDDGAVSTTTPDKSTIRYSAATDSHQKYNGSQWAGINTKLYTRLSVATALPAGTLTDIVFNAPVYNNGKYVNGVYTPTGTEYFKLLLSLNLNNVSSGGAIEVHIHNASTGALIQTVVNKKLYPNGATEFINATCVFNSSTPWKIVAKYTGDSTNATTTQYVTQNSLLVESI